MGLCLWLCLWLWWGFLLGFCCGLWLYVVGVECSTPLFLWVFGGGFGDVCWLPGFGLVWFGVALVGGPVGSGVSIGGFGPAGFGVVGVPLGAFACGAVLVWWLLLLRWLWCLELRLVCHASAARLRVGSAVLPVLSVHYRFWVGSASVVCRFDGVSGGCRFALGCALGACSCLGRRGACRCLGRLPWPPAVGPAVACLLAVPVLWWWFCFFPWRASVALSFLWRACASRGLWAAARGSWAPLVLFVARGGVVLPRPPPTPPCHSAPHGGSCGGGVCGPGCSWNALEVGTA